MSVFQTDRRVCRNLHRNVSSVPAHSCPEQLEAGSGCTSQSRPLGAQPLASRRGEVRRWTRGKISLASIRRPAATRNARNPLLACGWRSKDSPSPRTTEQIEPAEPRRITLGRCHISSLLLLPFGPGRAEPGRAGL